MRAEDFLDIVQGGNDKQAAFRLGKIPADYAGGRPRVLFDGETSASARTYPYLAGYTPAAGDRVLLAQVGRGWVVLGKIV